MPKSSGKPLSDLYPKPKSYEQLKAERERVRLAHRPKFVAPKIALWSTSGLFAGLATYALISLIMRGNLSSASAVIFGTCVSLFVCLIGMAVLHYFYTLIRDMSEKTLLLVSTLYPMLGCVLVASGLLLQLTQNRLTFFVASSVALIFNLVVTYFAVALLLKRSG